MKRIIALQKKIMVEYWKQLQGKKHVSFLISEDENFVYVSEHKYNIHKIQKCFWFLDNKVLGNFYILHSSLIDLADESKTYNLDHGHLSGVIKKDVVVAGRTYDLREVINNTTDEQIYLNEKLLKYIPIEECHIKCSSKSLVYFIDKRLLIVRAVVAPINV